MLVYFGEYAYNPCYIGLYSVFDVKHSLVAEWCWDAKNTTILL
jgi:hypothetical protein